MKKLYKIWGVIAIGAVIAIGLAGCESFGDFATGYSAGYSATSDTGLVYTIYNRSSVSVTLDGPGGSTGTLQPGQSGTQRFNSQLNLYNVTYSPSSVNCSISGTTITFTD
jgi:hypothetical protein